MTDIDRHTLERIGEQLGSVDELTQVVLKGHLLIEEALWRTLSKFVFHSEHLDAARLRYPQKVAIARAVSLDEHDSGMWDLIEAFNALRNDLAHSLESNKRAAKIEHLKGLYFRELAGHPEAEADRVQSDHIVVALAAALCLGFLSSFEEEVDRFREWLNVLDRTLNPHRHL